MSKESDPEIKYRAIAVDALNDNVTDALDQLLEMLKFDAGYENNLPAKTMVLLLNSMEMDQEEVKKYRSKMMDVLS